MNIEGGEEKTPDVARKDRKHIQSQSLSSNKLPFPTLTSQQMLQHDYTELPCFTQGIPPNNSKLMLDFN